MIESVKANARLEKRNENGVKERAFVERAAQKGNAEMLAFLELADNPPDCLAYLWERFWRLDGMREVDMNGPHRLTPSLIADAARLFGWVVTPLDAEALVMMDIARLNPDPIAETD